MASDVLSRLGIAPPSHWPWPSMADRARRGENAREAIRQYRLEGPVAAADQFRRDAEADGWKFSPTYSTEPVEQAFRGIRDGFVIQGIARPRHDNHMLPEGHIHAWGPDGISLNPLPLVYPGFDALKALVRHCPECGADDVETTRVAFANRACADCAPSLREKLERPGWNR